MKQAEQKEKTHLVICQTCKKIFICAEDSDRKYCVNCDKIGQTIPNYTLNPIQTDHVPINLQQDSPNDLLQKIKRTVSLNASDNNPQSHPDSRQEEGGINLSHQAIVDINSDSDESNGEMEKHIKQQLQQNIRKQQLQIKSDRKIFIGSGFTFDMTDFFKFKKKKELASQGQGTFFQEISGSPLAWLILLYTITSSALIPGWIMNIKATKFARKTWRFLMQAIFMIPFILYQRRTGSEQVKSKYKISYILDRKNIKKPYVSSLSACLWFLFVLTSFQWTFVSHGIVLGGLSNFFLSLSRSFRNQNHPIQSGGQVLVVLGVLLVLQDTLMVDAEKASPDDFQVLNTFYFYRTWWERLAGDFAAIFASFMMSRFSLYTSDLRSYYPPFLSIFMVNIFNAFHFCLIVYFFNGGSFDFDQFWGIFSIFTDQHFVSFMYMAIVLACGQMVSVFFVTRMFPDSIIPALALALEPFIASFIVQLANIQNLPGDFSMMGYLFIFPGILVVLIGQCLFQRQKSYNEQSDKRVRQLLDQINELKKINENHSARLDKKMNKKQSKRRKMYLSQQF